MFEIKIRHHFTDDVFSELFPEARITVTMRANLRHTTILHSSKGCGKRGKPVVKEARKRDNDNKRKIV